MTNTEVSDTSPYTETLALRDILEWSGDKSPWLRDALRRLASGGELANEDIDELGAICFGNAGGVLPLADEHIAPSHMVGKPVAITGLHDLVEVNALANNQGLSLSATGMTIVYGDNGSGKSGYVRVLKNACRSRDKKTDVLRNVNTETEVQQSAQIGFEVDGCAKTFHWRPDHSDHADLQAISIFDARSANIHVQETNNVAYVPFPMAMLDQLGKTCDKLHSRVKAEVDQLSNQTPSAIKTPSLSKETKAGSFLHGLSANSKPARLDQLVLLTDEEKSPSVFA